MMQYKELKKRQDKEEEDQFRQQMMAKFAEDDRIEQMNAQKRRMKQLEHQKAVEQMLEERRNQIARQKEKELEMLRDQEKRAAFERQIIEEERERLLQQHAPKLLGYLPKGVIRDEQDLKILGPEFSQAYSKRPGGGLY
jgi:hypothetical protein